MFAAGLYFEREPLKLADFPQGLQLFSVNAGLLTAIALFFWIIVFRLIGQKHALSDTPAWARVGFRLALVLGAIAYLAYGAMFVLEMTAAGTGPHRRTIYRVADSGLTMGG